MAHIVAGIDIGGTNSKIGIVDKQGRILVGKEISTTDYHSAEEFVGVLAETVKALAKEARVAELSGIGIGAPNASYYSGNIEQAVNLPWKGVVPIVKMMEEQTRLPARVTNDANAAALGEGKYGAAKGMKDFLVITLGTGLGSGFVANGQLIYGQDGFAGELGHVIVDRGGRECGCGRKGCLERYVSATGIVLTAKELLGSGRKSILKNTDGLSAKDIHNAAEGGDALALEAFDLTARTLGYALADVVAITCPEAIILFGGLTAAGDMLMKPTQRYMEEAMLPMFRGKVKLLQSALSGSDAAILGAAALAADL